jgi:hypothetical protein
MQNSEFMLKLLLENDELTKLQSVANTFENYKKNVDLAREKYLKNNNIFIKVFFRCWWLIDDYLFIKYRFLNLKQYVYDSYLKSVKYVEYLNSIF